MSVSLSKSLLYRYQQDFEELGTIGRGGFGAVVKVMAPRSSFCNPPTHTHTHARARARAHGCVCVCACVCTTGTLIICLTPIHFSPGFPLYILFLEKARNKLNQRVYAIKVIKLDGSAEDYNKKIMREVLSSSERHCTLFIQ